MSLEDITNGRGSSVDTTGSAEEKADAQQKAKAAEAEKAAAAAEAAAARAREAAEKARVEEVATVMEKVVAAVLEEVAEVDEAAAEVESIGNGAFNGCEGIESVTSAAGCVIGSSAFPAGCKTGDEDEDGEEEGEEFKMTDGRVCAIQTEKYFYMVSHGVRIMRFCNATGEVEKKEERWVPKILWKRPLTRSCGSGLCHNPEIQKRRKIFKKMCMTHGGFNLGKRTNMMASGCGRTCLPDAMLTLESHLKGVPVQDKDKAKTRKFFRELHVGDPNQVDAMVYGVTKGLNITFRQDTSPKILVGLTDACLVRLEYKYEEKGKLKLETHYMAFIDGMLIDNNKLKEPPVITYADRKDNRTAMGPFWHYFHETTKEIKLTHVYVVTVVDPSSAVTRRASKRPLEA